MSRMNQARRVAVGLASVIVVIALAGVGKIALGQVPEGSGAAVTTGLLAGAGFWLGRGSASTSRLSRCLEPAPAGRIRGLARAVRLDRGMQLDRGVRLDQRGKAAGATARRPARVQVPVPVVIDLVAAVVEAGLPPARAVRLVAGCLSDAGDRTGEELRLATAEIRSGPGSAAPSPWQPLFDALELAAHCGLGPVGLLRSAAEERRRRRAEALAVAARRLAVLAVVPTTLCLLPAFVVLTVVPLVLDLLPTG